LAAISICLALSEWFHPAKPPFTGKLSLVRQFLFDVFGVYAGAWVWLGVAVIAALAAANRFRNTTH
jgi:hypothetical protein